MRGVGGSRQTKQTTPQEGGGAAPSASVIIDGPALLALAAWCQQRQEARTGGTACPTPSLDAPRPPAPEAEPHAADAAGVGSSAGRPTEATARTARPTARPTSRRPRRQGGRP